MIGEAVEFPFQDEDWFRKGLGGYILALASMLVVPAPLLLGYMIRVMREEQMPGFNNLVKMFADGLKAVAILLAYMLPGMAIMASFDSGLALIGLPVFLIGFYIVESGFYELANNGFRSAFTSKVLKNAFTLNYLIGAIAAVIVPTAIFIAWIFSLILILPVLLYPAAVFYADVARYRIMKEAIEAE
jgi:hypothetical protein